MSLSEASARAAALALYRKRNPQAVVFRHEDSIRAGVPDASISNHGITSWWEFKFEDAQGRIKWRGAQSAEMCRLWSRKIPAYFAIWRPTTACWWIVPAGLNHDQHKNFKDALYEVNSSHRFLVDLIERVHREGRLP